MKKLHLNCLTLFILFVVTANAQVTDTGDKVGIGTANPKSTLHIKSTSKTFNEGNSPISANLLIEGTNTTKTPEAGAVLGFAIPANTNGSNAWQQGRIYVNSDNTMNANASGRMYLQTRYLNNGTWSWRENLVLRSSGYVGIGISNPTDKLHVDGNIRSSSKFVITDIGAIDTDSDDMKLWSVKKLILGAGGDSNNHMVIQNDGNIGIGITNPSEKLTVKGKILCEEVEVVLNAAAPDYVFEKYYTGASNLKSDYVMPTLEEVETYTKNNHHLPEIPSAATLKEDGLQLKEMSVLLLQKIEELTLYTIEQEKRIKALEAQIAK